MAYYSGTASSLADLRTALLTHAVADGWVLTGDVLSKAGVYFQIQVTATNITCLGCESNAVANPAPGVVMIGRIYFASGQPTREISFPCNYEVFGFAQELYLVANYDVDSYQWMAFGKSTVPGLIGQGGWCSATLGAAIAQTTPSVGSTAGPVFLDISGLDSITTYGGQSYSSCAMAGNIPSGVNTQGFNVHVNHNLDAHGWRQDATVNPVLPIGLHACTQLLWQQPSVWNGESVLLPLRFYKQRASFKSSLILDCVNARHLRIDNLAPGDILTLGSDKWRVFPWYRKSAADRNGSSGVSSGFRSFNHTGTFGWAIRYEGP